MTDSICLLHLPVASANSFSAAERLELNQQVEQGRCIHIRTCQREIWLGTSAFLSPPPELTIVGVEAYEFLLRVACGLESRVLGETDIFGQIKEAWKNYQEKWPLSARILQPCFLQLFEDTKDLRSRMIHGLGGQTYGSLVRQLVQPKTEHRILVIGAGQIAESVLPYLLESEILLCNRTQARAENLASTLLQTHPSARIQVVDYEEILSHVQASDHLLFCTPGNETSDSARLNAWSKNGVAVHLGAHRNQFSQFLKEVLPENVHFLNDVFEIQTARDQDRERAIRQAVNACRERALLRSLGGSITIAHGWEDLGVFAYS